MIEGHGAYQIDWPEDFGDRELEIADMGVLRDIAVITQARRLPVTFYDPSRVRFAIGVFVDTWNPSFAERNLVVNRRVDRANIEAAIEHMSQDDFKDLG